MPFGLAIKLPMSRDETDSIRMIKTDKELIKQNLRSLLLTNPGERVMDVGYGVGVYAHLFDNVDENSISNFKARLTQQVEKYMPYLNIIDAEAFTQEQNSNVESNTLKIVISYFIPAINVQDSLFLNLNEL